MGLYTDDGNVTPYTHSGDPFIDAFLIDQYGSVWATQAGGKTSISYSLPWTTNPTALFEPDYGQGEPDATTVFGLNDAQKAALLKGFQHWEDVANIDFVEVAETAAGVVGDIRVAFSSALPATAWGWASYPWPWYNSPGDIWINPTQADSRWDDASYSLNAITHEIGHALGLKHPFEAPAIPAGFDNRRYTIMSYTDPDGVWWYNPATSKSDYLLTSPMVYDIKAIQYLYGANMSFHTGNDVYSYANNAPFFKTIWDAGGTDSIDLSTFTNACAVSLEPGSYSTLGFSNHTVTDNLGIAFDCYIENATGGAGDDTLSGNALANTLKGMAGADHLVGNGGNDVLEGGAGIDQLEGGAGNDSLLGGAGNDAIDGGSGDDLARYTDAAAAVSVDLVAGKAGSLAGGDVAKIGTDTLVSIESISGGRYNDVLLGNTSNNRLWGLSGNDTLKGGAGSDTMYGGDGNDRLEGGPNKDVMTGGLGSDTFAFDDGDFAYRNVDTCDRISDFSHSELDRIDMSLVDANSLNGTGDDAFAFIGRTQFSHIAGQLRYFPLNGNTFLVGDMNGDAVADFWVRVDGLVTLAPGDLVL